MRAKNWAIQSPARPAVSCGTLISVLLGVSLPAQTLPPRKWLAAPMHIQSIMGASREELLIPGSLVATPKGELIVFDHGTMQLRAFNTAGQELWRAGRKGAGPGEFRNAMDVELRANGEFAVLDMSNRRITTVSPAGQVRRTTPLTFTASRFVPLSDTTQFALASDDSTTLWTAVNTHGQNTARIASPPWLSRHGSLARETFTSSLGQGAVMTFRWSHEIILLNGEGAVRTVIHGVEPVPLPGIKSYPLNVGKFKGYSSRIDPKATPGALSVTTRGQDILVLFAGATQFRGRIVDVYNATTGAYKGSHLLPSEAVEIATLNASTIATLRLEPIPGIDVWQLPAAKAGSSSTRRKAGR